MLVHEIQKLLYSKVKNHFSDLYNIVEFGLLAAYIAVMTLSYYSMSKVRDLEC
jgi:hypothetical protein